MYNNMAIYYHSFDPYMHYLHVHVQVHVFTNSSAYYKELHVKALYHYKNGTCLTILKLVMFTIVSVVFIHVHVAKINSKWSACIEN